MQILRTIGDWYVIEEETYIRVFRAMNPPNIFPNFILYKLIIQKIAYQPYFHGVVVALVLGKKSLWPNTLMHICYVHIR